MSSSLSAVRRVGVLTAVLAAMVPRAAPSLAGDAAQLNILGFSPDGAIFAFEQYGIQDGSGFPYSERFYIDTETDSFVANTPIRIRLDDETADVEEARKKAADAGAAIVPNEVLTANPGVTAGMNPVTEVSADPFRIVVNPRPIFPPVDDQLEFRLEQFSLATPKHCEGLEGIAGFRLLSIDAKVGGTTRLLHEDKSVPASRGCPVGYRIGVVQTFFPEKGRPVTAVLVSVERVGFEGPDHRWLAVTGQWTDD